MSKTVSELAPGDVVRFKDGDETVVSVTERRYPASTEWGTSAFVMIDVLWADGVTGQFYPYERFTVLS